LIIPRLTLLLLWTVLLVSLDVGACLSSNHKNSIKIRSQSTINTSGVLCFDVSGPMAIFPIGGVLVLG